MLTVLSLPPFLSLSLSLSSPNFPSPLTAVGKAFGEDLYLNKEIMEVLFDDKDSATTSPYRKMAMV